MTFEDHQKTLSSLGFTSGTALLRIRFEITNIPLENALEQIAEFSPNETPPAETALIAPATEAPSSNSKLQSLLDTPVPKEIQSEVEPSVVDEEDVMDVDSGTAVENEAPSIRPGERVISVFNPSENNTPEAAKSMSSQSYTILHYQCISLLILPQSK